MRTHDIAVEQFDLVAALAQLLLDQHRDRGFAGAGEASEPDDKACGHGVVSLPKTRFYSTLQCGRAIFEGRPPQSPPFSVQLYDVGGLFLRGGPLILPLFRSTLR